MTLEEWVDSSVSQSSSLLSAKEGGGAGAAGGRTLQGTVVGDEDNSGSRGSSRAGMRAGRRNRGRRTGHRGAEETAQSAIAASEGGSLRGCGCCPCFGTSSDKPPHAPELGSPLDRYGHSSALISETHR